MLLGNIIQNIALTKLVVLWFGRKLPTESGSDGFAGYCWPDGSSGMRAGRAHRSHTLLAGNMAANTTAPAADTVWINVGAVRGAVPVLDSQLLEFSQRMSPRDVAMQVSIP